MRWLSIGITDAKLWTLDRRVFQKIMVTSGRQEHEDNMRFLSSVPLLNDERINPQTIAELSQLLRRVRQSCKYSYLLIYSHGGLLFMYRSCLQEFFPAGSTVVRQGDRGDKFYIIRGGKVLVTKRTDDGAELYIGTLSRGEFFGEQALLHEHRRLATVTAQPPGVECLTMDREY